MNLDDIRAYQADGLMRQDLQVVRKVEQADWVIINHQREYVDSELEVWSRASDPRPVQVLQRDGVPLASLYRLGSP